MSEKQDVDKLKMLLEAADDLVEFVEDVMSDGKVDIADAAKLMSLQLPAMKLYEVFKNKEELVAELKDIDWDEVAELADVLK